MKLDNTFSIKTDNHNFILIEKVNSVKKDGVTPLVTEKPTYCGALYQCLIEYLRKSTNKAKKLTSVQHVAEKTVANLRDMEEEIKATFRIEGRAEKP